MDTTRASLRHLLHAGIDPLTQMPLTSSLLHRLTGCFSLSLIRVDSHCAPREHYSEHFDDVSHQLFAAAGHHFSAATDDPAAFGTLLRNPGRPVGTLIRGQRAFVEGATYQHLFKRNGIHHVLDLALRDDSGPLGILGLFREARAQPFTAADVRAVDAVYDDLVHAFRAPVLPDDFDEADSAVLLTSSSGVIEWATPTARQWLEDTTGGPERAALMIDGALPAACRHLARALATGDEAPPTMTLPVPGGRLRLRAWGLTPFAGPVLERRVAIELRLEMHRGLKMLAGLERVSLTPQLRRLAWLLWRRRRPADICAALDIGAQTLKSYTKELYARLDVTSANELLACLDGLADDVSLDLRRHLPTRRAASA
ncbi:MAG TPA: hypothetical protein VGF99_19380 [Myxococcota bacterium]